MASTKRGTKASQTAASTYMRSIEMQSWPLLAKAARTAPGTALLRSASARISSAFLPPSSIELSTSRPAAWLATRRPTRVLPVNMTKSLCSMTGVPSSAPEPVTTCSTPGGSPASSSSTAPHSAE